MLLATYFHRKNEEDYIVEAKKPGKPWYKLRIKCANEEDARGIATLLSNHAITFVVVDES